MATGPISSDWLGNNFAPKGQRRWQDYLWLTGFLVLPFVSYLGLAILLVLSLVSWRQQRGQLLAWLWQQGYGWLSLGFLVSAGAAAYPGDAFLQTANFLPYFLMLGALVVRYGGTPYARRIQQLTVLALALVLTSLPFSLLAIVEYGIKFPTVAAQVDGWWVFRWAFDVSFVGHRAHGTLGHPNILSAYLVMVVSLGLGLLGATLAQAKPSTERWSGVAIATLAGLIGIFCTGSRNGLLIAVIQILVFTLCVQRQRWLQITGLSLIGALGVGALSLGVGGRHLGLELITQDPRLEVWEIALNLARHRPILGWGLGGFGHLYIPQSVTNHEHVHHAHNLWLYLASEVGIPMTLGFCWVIGRVLYRTAREILQPSITAQPLATQSRSIITSYLMAFSGCMLFGLFDVPLFDVRINALGWLLLACLYLATPQVPGVTPAAITNKGQGR
ncbi:MAG: O-antigen ligase family protein, partial [Cyanobacteria bacterium P01_A01_bin.105]